MANYIELETGRYPVSQSQIRAENPNTSYPASFPVPEGFALVFPSPTPTYDPITQYVREIAPELTNGKYYQAFEVLGLEQEQIDTNIANATAAFIANVTQATQSRLDTFARTRNYDGILSACTYASSAVPQFQTEGQYCVNARDSTWATLYTLMGQVQAGTTPMPATVEDVMAVLPELVWPPA